MDFFWEKNDWETLDLHLSSLKQAPFQRPTPAVSLSDPGVSLIRGPRQVGKSTWLKLLLSQHVTEAGGKSCFFHTCEDLVDHQDLTALIQSQLPARRFFFLDEITFVDEWWRSIKKFVDTRKDLHFILTGSNSFDLRKGLDAMPGRWSQSAGELQLSPMLFQEWSEMIQQAGWSQSDRVTQLRRYMRIGGFPSALMEAGPEYQMPRRAMQSCLRWILGDVAKLGRQELFMKELLLQIIKSMGSSMSLQTLAQKTQLMSYHTAQDYLSVLEHSFALRTLYAYDPDTDSFRFKKEKKFYFTDPLFFWMVADLAGLDSTSLEVEEKLAEMIVAEELCRRYPRLGYYSTSRHGEVDFISCRDLAVEVKWAPAVANLSKAFKDLKVAEKKVWSQQNLLMA